MKVTRSIISSIFYLILLTPSFSFADKHNIGVKNLSPELRELLKKEMLALEKGMLEIFPAYISGDFKKIETIAHQMKNSFIMKQNITQEQKHELHSKLPQSFVSLDQQFHYMSGMLEHVAERQKIELVGFYFSELSDACASCHSQYATEKFPAFISKKEKHEH